MTNKIFRSTVFVAVLVLLCSLGIVMGVLYNHFTAVQVQQLKDELSLAVTGTEQYGNAFLENVEADRFRLTWIDTDGTVLFDTQVDQTAMENHADREEIREAFATGSGSAVRNSSTLTEQTYYEARRLTDGTVLRISANQASAWALMMDLLWPIILIAVLAIGLSALLARLRQPKWRHGKLGSLLMALAIVIAVLVNIAMQTAENSLGLRQDLSFNRYATTGESTRAALARLENDVELYLLYQNGEENSRLLQVLSRYAALSDRITVLRNGQLVGAFACHVGQPE